MEKGNAEVYKQHTRKNKENKLKLKSSTKFIINNKILCGQIGDNWFLMGIPLKKHMHIIPKVCIEHQDINLSQMIIETHQSNGHPNLTLH